MMYLLDTCVISDFFKGDKNVVNAFSKRPPNTLSISSVTVMEVEYSLAINKARSIKLEPLWQALIRQIEIISYNHEDARATAYIRSYLKEKGTPIGPYDILLAGMALNRHYTFITSNTREFIRVPNLKVEDWRINHSDIATIEA